MTKLNRNKELNLDNVRIFGAFSKEQFEEGKKNINFQEGEKLVSIGAGGFVAKDDLQKLKDALNDHSKKFKQDDPQTVYDYEYGNYECGYFGDDAEAVMRVIETFGVDVARGIDRYSSYKIIDRITKELETR